LLALLILLAAFCVFTAGAQDTRAAHSAIAGIPRPNLLLLIADDLGFGDVGYNGSEIRTAHLDALAKQGVRFDRWYAALPSCTPTRFALLTGRLPQRSADDLSRVLMPAGRAAKNDARCGIRAEEVTLAEKLRAAGYRTALLGKWHLGYGEKQFFPTRHGFEVFQGHLSGCVDYFTLNYGNLPDWYVGESLLPTNAPERGRYATDVIADAALGFLKQAGTTQPFFLTVAFNAPHYGKIWDAARSNYVDKVQAKPEDIAACAQIADPKRRVYAAAVQCLDANIGRILAHLKQSGLEENTWIVFTSDNGGMPRDGGRNFPLRGAKGTLFEGGVRVPGLMRWPGRLEPGTVSQQTASVLDVLPTVCAQLGISTAGMPLDGVSLGPALFAGQPIARDLYFQLPSGDRAFQRSGWKYLRAGNETLLFNLIADPNEQDNLATQHPDRVAELEAAWAKIKGTLPRR
jgi:arylsulfatase A-like enzyme